MKPYYSEDGVTIYHGDCRDILPALSGINLIATDPPYNGVVLDDWDNQWMSNSAFLEWAGNVAIQLRAVATDNATLYWFCSPRLAARTEAMIAEHFAVIAHVTWDKGDARQGAAGSGVDISALRTFWSSTSERVVVAEMLVNSAFENADAKARDASGYWTQCEATKRALVGDYLRAEFARAGVTAKQIAALFPSKTGGMTGCVSNWLLGYNLPTPEQYASIREHLNMKGDEYLRREYEDLRREYEDLRREYEDLRRPFFLNERMQWGDVWRFQIERERDHPTQKPMALMKQIVTVSSRSGDIVLDPFMGSGTTLRAAKDLGRQAIGIEIEERYCEIAAKRLRQRVLPLEYAPVQ